MKKNVVKDVATVGLMVAFIEAEKFALAGIPNVELTSFFLIMFALYFGRLIYFAIPVFILIEGAVYSFGLWWIMYLYAWPLLVLATRLIGKRLSGFGLAMLSGAFGLSFGALCAIPYIFIGTFDGGVLQGLKVAAAYWVAGIPFDIIHGVANFMIMLLLYKPIVRVMKRVKESGFSDRSN